ncbi:hypothetical protein ACFSS9_19430 [Paenibacillus septentrionalis]
MKRSGRLPYGNEFLEQRGALTKRTHVEAAIELSMYYEHKRK